MSVRKLKKIESLLLDVIIFCTDEAECEQDVIDELHSLKERVYKLQRRMPHDAKNDHSIRQQND